MKEPEQKKPYGIAISYLQGAFSEEELCSLETILEEHSISLHTQEKEPRAIMGVEVFFPQIQIFLSSPIAQTLIWGLATNALYDAIKWFLVFLRNMVKKKPLVRIKSGEIKENVETTIHFNIDKMHVVLPMAIDEKRFQYFIDKAFETAKLESFTSESFFIYSEECDSGELYSKDEMIQKVMEESQKAN